MTNEEMADDLRKAGWRIKEPLTQANCKHPNMMGSGGIGTDGSGFIENRCPACGYSSRNAWGPSKERSLSVTRPHHETTPSKTGD